MGRYYSGDINGKFWFGVQSSNAAERFGGQHTEPQYTQCDFYEDDLDDINNEIAIIEHKLRDTKKIFDDYFLNGAGTNDDLIVQLMAKNDIKITKEEAAELVSDYADLLLGIKIRDFVVENGGCSFEAEY